VYLNLLFFNSLPRFPANVKGANKEQAARIASSLSARLSARSSSVDPWNYANSITY